MEKEHTVATSSCVRITSVPGSHTADSAAGASIAKGDRNRSSSSQSQSQETLVRQTFERMEAFIKEKTCLMFSTESCPYCVYAQDYFLEKTGVQQCHVIKLDEEKNRLLGAVVTAVTNQRTVPNIFLHQMHVGGYDELLAVERQCRNPESILRKEKRYENVCGFFKPEETTAAVAA